MPKWMIKLSIIALMSTLSACVSLQSVSLTQIPKKRSKMVSASSDKFLFFFISFSNDYVDDVARQLKSKCPGGTVTGILTKDSLTTYFPLILSKREVSARGYCVKG